MLQKQQKTTIPKTTLYGNAVFKKMSKESGSVIFVQKIHFRVRGLLSRECTTRTLNCNNGIVHTEGSIHTELFHTELLTLKLLIKFSLFRLLLRESGPSIIIYKASTLFRKWHKTDSNMTCNIFKIGFIFAKVDR